jgi:glycosyltransferase involved in cell wall biosynthesis
MEAADKVITVSNLTRTSVIEKYGIDPAKVVTVHNAVSPVPERKNQKYRKIPGEKIVTFMGRITIQKGPEFFVEAANLVLKRMPHTRFVMAGSGDLANHVIEHTARLGISDRFHFTGFIEGAGVYNLLDITDVFVMPSVSEPFGIAPLEAMQAGVPVIVSRQSGVAEIVKHIFTIDFWDTYAMADAIYGLLKYPALARFFSHNGTIEAQNLKWKNSAGLISDIYRELLQGETNNIPSVPRKINRDDNITKYK